MQIIGSQNNLTVISYGVPRGFILGSLLFLLYIDDMYSVTDPRSIQFAVENVFCHK